VTNLSSNDVTIFSIDQASGGLTPLSLPVSSGNGPTSITLDPQGRFAYVTNALDDNISVFAVDTASGTLTRSSTAFAGINPIALSMDTSGRFAYVANLGSNNITVFTVDPATGTLTPAGPPAGTLEGPTSVVLVK
jgi:6-phosphogluconolactonase (cycloisomerase 2 family)